MVIIGPSALQTYIVEVADKEDVRQLGARVHAMLRLGDEKKLSFMASALVQPCNSLMRVADG